MTNQPNKVAVIGGGSFGTAISHLLANNGLIVMQWMRNQEHVDHINEKRENPRYMQGHVYPDNVTATTDMADAVNGAEAVYFSIPSKAYREVCKQLAEVIDPSQVVISTTKGIEKDTFALMTDIMFEETCVRKLGVLSGPNLAKEILAGQPTGTVVASPMNEVIETGRRHLASKTLRIYSNNDMQGVELAGALKNIYAVASGLMSALKFGENTRSMILTRALAEMSRFAVKYGANPMTFLGLAGVGDLIATCSSPLSRNYRVGHAIGEGKTLEQAVEELGETAEGVNTIQLVKLKADELGVRMPLVHGLYAVLFGGISVSSIGEELMTGDFAQDVEFEVR